LPGEYIERSAAVLADLADVGIELPRRLLDELARLDDWVVESDGGAVLIYRHEKVVSGGKLPRFLESVRRIARALESPPPSPGAEADPGEPHSSACHVFRRDEPGYRGVR
jgi:hypothetical protein